MEQKETDKNKQLLLVPSSSEVKVTSEAIVHPEVIGARRKCCVSQRRCMQQLLQIATNESTDGKNSGEIDAEKREFFDKYLSQFGTESDVKIILENLEYLEKQKPDDLNLLDCGDAITRILEVVDSLDLATIFMQNNGYQIVKKFLYIEDSDLIYFTCHLIAVSSQNHPPCQDAVASDPTIFNRIFAIIRSANYEDYVKKKALFALSSAIQHNDTAHQQFVELGGYDAFRQLMKEATLRLRTRLCFIIDCFCSQYPMAVERIVKDDFMAMLAEILLEIPQYETKEAVLNLVLTLVKSSKKAITDCRNANGAYELAFTQSSADDDERDLMLQLRRIILKDK